MTFLIALVLGVGLPVGWWMFKDARRKNPATRWPDVAQDLGMKFMGEPPRIEGVYRGRNFRLSAEGDGAAIITGLRGRAGLRVEIGPKAVVEKAAGMVVPDRVVLRDSAFEARYLVRATPPEFGEAAADPALRQRLMKLPDLHVLAIPDRVMMKLPLPTEAADVRTYFDIVSAVADSVES